MPKSRVLFLCNANACRSQMAEAFLRMHANDRFEVYSAGFAPTELHPFTVQVMEELGVGMDGHFAKSSRQFLGQDFDYVITVCDPVEPSCPKCFPGVRNYWNWSFDDPLDSDEEGWELMRRFRAVRDQIEARIHAMLQVVPS